MSSLSFFDSSSCCWSVSNNDVIMIGLEDEEW
jgi:hypothetical protein